MAQTLLRRADSPPGDHPPRAVSVGLSFAPPPFVSPAYTSTVGGVIELLDESSAEFLDKRRETGLVRGILTVETIEKLISALTKSTMSCRVQILC